MIQPQLPLQCPRLAAVTFIAVGDQQRADPFFKKFKLLSRELLTHDRLDHRLLVVALGGHRPESKKQREQTANRELEHISLEKSRPVRVSDERGRAFAPNRIVADATSRIIGAADA